MQLQTYNYNRVRYTVDYKLEQFRTVDKWGRTHFIEFDDYRGDKILCKMIADKKLDYSQYKL